MHIVLGILGSVITILILLNRLAQAGIDLGGLNPFLWNRRRKWRNLYEGDPVFKIADPMDATAILMVAAAKADGDMTKEEKALLVDLFEREFKLSKKDAAGLLISSVHLLGDGEEVRNSVGRFLANSKEAFTGLQIESALALIGQAAGLPGEAHPNAQAVVEAVKKEFPQVQEGRSTWQ